MSFNILPYQMPIGLLGLICWIGCAEPDKETEPESTAPPASEPATEDTGSQQPTEPSHPVLSLTQDDTPLESTLRSSAQGVVSITGDNITGTCEYTEKMDDAEPHCNATLTIEGSKSDTICQQSMPDNDWCFAYTVATDQNNPDCLFADGTIALNIAQSNRQGFIGYMSEYVDSNDNIFTNYMVVGAVLGNTYENTGNAQWNQTDQTITLNISESTTPISNLYQECGGTDFIESNTNFISETVISGSIICPTEPEDNTTLVDVWELQAEVGQTIGATVDIIEELGAKLAVVAPDGCLLGDSSNWVTCNGNPELYCPSVSFAATQAGTHKLLVYFDECEEDIGYQIDAVVE